MEELDDRGKAAVHYAAEEGHASMLAAMIEKGVDVNLAEDVPAQSGTTALHEACSYGYEDVVRLLINAGADDTLKNANGKSGQSEKQDAHTFCGGEWKSSDYLSAP